MSIAVNQNNRNLFTLVFTVFLDFVGFGIVLPIIAPIMLDRENGVLSPDVSYSARTIILGFLVASFTVAQFFGAPMLGTLSDKYGRKKILLISIAGTVVSVILFGIGIKIRSLALLFISRIFNGLMGGNVAAAQSSIADMSDYKTKARNFGLMGMAFGLGFVLGPYLGGKLSDPTTVRWFDFATPFWFTAILSVVNIVLITWLLKETLVTPKELTSLNITHGIHNVIQAFTRPNLRKIFTVGFLTIVGFSFFTQFFQVYLIEEFNFNQADIGQIFGYIGIWIAFTQGGIVRVLSHRIHPEQVIRVSLLTLSIGLFLLLLPRQSFWFYYVLPFVAMSMGSTTPNMAALVSNTAGANEQGEVLG
ncbi:MAG: MFS transporter, partial [Bacteroidetes bacterium]